MNFKVLFSLLILIGLLASCNKDDQGAAAPNDDKVLVFGTYSGECFGERCVEIFQLTASDLSEDREDIYAGAGPFDFELLPQENFELVKDLRDEIPAELISEDSQTFGCPDCGDWGGIYVSWTEDSVTKEWNIDTMKDDIPVYLHDFIDRIQESVQLLNG